MADDPEDEFAESSVAAALEFLGQALTKGTPAGCGFCLILCHQSGTVAVTSTLPAPILRDALLSVLLTVPDPPKPEPTH